MRLAVGLLFSAVLWAQSANTRVTGTIVGAGGTNPSGTATISWIRTLNNANPRAVIYPGSRVITITDGVVDVSLFPSNAQLPISTCYSVAYTLNGVNSRRYWYVPISATPVNLQIVEGDTPCPTQTGAIIAPAQISPGGAGLTQVLTSGPTGLVSWATGGGGGGGSPGGVTNSIQYNLSPSAFGGISNFLTDGTNPLFAISSAPSAPSAGFGAIYEDSTSLNLAFKNSAGTVNHGVQTKAAVSNQFLTSISDAGLVTAAQPSFSSLTGSATCAQLPALTGDTTTSAGTCATTTVKVNGVTYGTSPSTNTVPVVTSSNTITYEAVPNAALANSATTVNGQTCTLGSTCTIALGSGVNSQSATYLAVSGDNGKLITMNCTSCTLTLPAAPPSSTWAISVENLNSTTLTVSRNGLTINGASSNITLPQYWPIFVWTDGTNYFATTPPVQGSNMTLSFGANGLTLASSGGSASGCVPAGSANQLLTDDGAGACTSNGNASVSAGGIFTKIAGISTTGLGVPAIGWVSNVTARTTSQTTVTLATSPTAGSYRLIYYANQNALCTTGSESVNFTFNWTDAGNARVLNTGNLALATAQSTLGYLSGVFPVYVGSGNVTYISTISGACSSGTASYDIHASLERLQ